MLIATMATTNQMGTRHFVLTIFPSQAPELQGAEKNQRTLPQHPHTRRSMRTGKRNVPSAKVTATSMPSANSSELMAT